MAEVNVDCNIILVDNLVKPVVELLEVLQSIKRMRWCICVFRFFLLIVQIGVLDFAENFVGQSELSKFHNRTRLFSSQKLLL